VYFHIESKFDKVYNVTMVNSVLKDGIIWLNSQTWTFLPKC
jgi:hypothetical protein